MEEDKVENDVRPETSGKEKEIHYHYHMDESGPPRGSATHQKRPGEVHYHYYYEPPRIQKQKSMKPTIAGTLLLIHLIVTILAVVFLVAAGFFVSDMGEGFVFFGEESTGDVTGNVTLLDGTPVENATVTIVETQLTATTNAQGQFLIYNVPSGNQKIQVEKEGYNTLIYKAFIEPQDIDINMGNNGDSNGAKNDFSFTLTEGNGVVEDGSWAPIEFLRSLVIVCTVALIILSIFVLLGTIAAFRRRNFNLAIIGAIAGILSLGLLPLIALFILLLAKEEFEDPKKKLKQTDTPGGETS